MSRQRIFLCLEWAYTEMGLCLKHWKKSCLKRLWSKHVKVIFLLKTYFLYFYSNFFPYIFIHLFLCKKHFWQRNGRNLRVLATSFLADFFRCFGRKLTCFSVITQSKIADSCRIWCSWCFWFTFYNFLGNIAFTHR